MKRFFRALVRRPVALVSIIVLASLYFAMIFAEFLSPYTPGTTFAQSAYVPPNLVLYSPTLGFGPQVQERVLIDQVNWTYARIAGQYHRVRFFVRGPEYRLWGLIPARLHLFGTEPPSGSSSQAAAAGGAAAAPPGSSTAERAAVEEAAHPVFLFGADHLGRDLFSRVLYGARVSLTIGLIGIAISLGLAILLGGLAGYYGGAVDWVLMRAAELFMLIPGLYLILFLRSVLSRNLNSAQSFLLITVILSFVGWPGSARLVRGMVHSFKREDFVSAAQLAGVPSLVIIFRYVIPQMSSILIVSVTLGIPGFILGETVLSYLGLGIVDPAVSWGSLLNRQITTLSNLTSFPWLLYPGLFLLLTTLAFNFLGDLLRDLLDPYHRERRAG
jgi:peptide/nickel transport system permease protein